MWKEVLREEYQEKYGTMETGNDTGPIQCNGAEISIETGLVLK